MTLNTPSEDPPQKSSAVGVNYSAPLPEAPSHKGPYAAEPATQHDSHQSFWLWIMCLTGVDYFSTLAYQPSIAFEAAGVLAPMATIVLVLVTLFGALPVYSYVASRSPHGQGSIAMLERLLHGWTAKTMVLILLGFAATDFVITKTLSAADAAVHLVKNPLWQDAPDWILQYTETGQLMIVTMFLLVLLGASFMRGFREVIGVAVVIVGVYLALNVIILVSGLVYLIIHPELFQTWYHDVAIGNWQATDHLPIEGEDLWTMIAICLLIFPKLALGLSGFETGVAVMPLIQGEPSDDPHEPKVRIRNTRKLLLTAACIMSVMLLGSSFLTAVVIEHSAMHSGGLAHERALAYLAHGEGANPINPMFGMVFGTIYDISTIMILGFAGASAMAGLLNLVPQYLPRYGMAPEWARAIRPLVLMFTGINLLVTWIFDADVSAQGGAYATGVLVLITSACVATVVDKFRHSTRSWLARVPWLYVLITAVFIYTTAANMIERPDGIKIASFFIIAIVVASFGSRLMRSTELRFAGFEFADDTSRFLWDSLKHLEFPVLVPHRPGGRQLARKEQSIRAAHRLGPEIPIVFIEAEVGDPSEFQQHPLMQVHEEEGRFVISVQRCVSVAHVIATIALECSRVGKPPEIHFGWSNESPLAASFGFLIFGEGNVPWMVRELIRRAQPDDSRQPKVVIG
ncbi:MAG: amino acid transporter [Planctomycetota bacterium]|nr:amino acid transporter [Planctomycetota bacterium]